MFWGASQCKVYLNPNTYKGDIIIKTTSQHKQKSRVFGNYVNEIWNARPGARYPRAPPANWDSRWHGNVIIQPHAPTSTEAPFEPGETLIDMDTYVIDSLSFNTTVAGRVQLTNVTIGSGDPGGRNGGLLR